MELTTAALAAKLCGVEADDELLSVLCAAAEQAWKNRLQSGVTPADCGSALPCAAAFTAAADYLGKRSRVESMTVGEVTVRGLSAASAKELAEALEVSRQTIGSLENGRYNPSILLAFKLARYFGTTIEDIFIYEEEQA